VQPNPYKQFKLTNKMWSLYENEKDGKIKALLPLKFSNNKSQDDIVEEVKKAIVEGHKTIFIRGVCGTGKSAIALNLAKDIGKTSIVVPGKNLQKQYEQDYSEKKYLLKDNKDKLKIKVITGRQNFICPFLKEYEVDRFHEEKNSTLDFFSTPTEKIEYKGEKSDTCDNPLLPCKIEIVEKNLEVIKEYIKGNPKVKRNFFNSIKDIRRLSIAPVCPYWSPIWPSDLKLTIFEDANPKTYQGLKNTKYTIYQRKPGCGYCDQYQSYIDSDVLIFNSHKYKIETTMNRKPETEIEIIDECDEFLDSFANYNKININRFYFALSSLFPEDNKTMDKIQIIGNTLKELLKTPINSDIIPLKESKILPILKEFASSDLMNCVEADEENYCWHVDEVAKEFENFIDETYISYEKERDLEVKIITTNLEKRFKELQDKSKIIVMMSGTIHSERVLKDVFGLKDFKIIEAETAMPGTISPLRTGLEIDCKYANFKQGFVTREQYLKALNKCIVQSIKPTLVHVNSFQDLPTEQEARSFNLTLMTQEKLSEQQKVGSVNEYIRKFKNKEIPILYTTKCNRGVDFPGDMCNSIVLTKYPYPDVGSLFWRILKKTHPSYYNEFYIDKSQRELLQKIYRGLRFSQDHVYLLSPDIRVFQNFEF